MTENPTLYDHNVDVEQLKAMLDCIAEGVFTVDADKKIVFFNSAAERITEFSVEEAVGQPCQDKQTGTLPQKSSTLIPRCTAKCAVTVLYNPGRVGQFLCLLKFFLRRTAGLSQI